MASLLLDPFIDPFIDPFYLSLVKYNIYEILIKEDLKKKETDLLYMPYVSIKYILLFFFNLFFYFYFFFTF